MAELGNLALLLAIAVPGWLVFLRLRMPGAPILGAMAAVGLSQVAGLAPGPQPQWLQPSLQVVVGTFIGLRVRADTRQRLAGLAPVAALVSAWWLAAAFASGYLLYWLTRLDLLTALLGSTPGGISEMGLLALHFRADAGSVALLQFFRVTLVLAVVPLMGPRLFPALARLAGAGVGAGTLARAGATAAEVTPTRPEPPPEVACPVAWTSRLLLYGRTLAVAIAGGMGLEAAGFPAGGLVGSMLAVGGLRAAGVACAGFPEDVRNVAQVGLGGLIGLGFTAEVVGSLGHMILPVAVLTAAMLAFGFALAAITHRMTGWDLMTCVLATSAGGLTNISAIAEDLGADPVRVTLLHVVRLVTIVAVLPPAFAALL